MMILDNFNVYWTIAINGIFTGLGVSLGSYFAQSHIINRSKKIVKKISKIKKIRFIFEKDKK